MEEGFNKGPKSEEKTFCIKQTADLEISTSTLEFKEEIVSHNDILSKFQIKNNVVTPEEFKKAYDEIELTEDQKPSKIGIVLVNILRDKISKFNRILDIFNLRRAANDYKHPNWRSYHQIENMINFNKDYLFGSNPVPTEKQATKIALMITECNVITMDILRTDACTEVISECALGTYTGDELLMTWIGYLNEFNMISSIQLSRTIQAIINK